MGSGRGDRNQPARLSSIRSALVSPLQWGPVVVTGISVLEQFQRETQQVLQWGPVVVTGISADRAARTALQVVLLQWGPVVVTGISFDSLPRRVVFYSFNGVRSW